MKKLVFYAAFFALGCADATDPAHEEIETQPDPGFTFDDETLVTPTEREVANDPLIGTTWFSEQIGNVMSVQDWWTFEDAGVFRRSIVRSREQNSATLEKFSGSWTFDGSMLRLRGRSLDTEFDRTFTTFVGADALMTNAFVETEPGTFERFSRSMESRTESFRDERVTVSVAFGKDPFASGDCEMAVTIQVGLIAAASAEADEGETSFSLPCSVKYDDTGARFVSADTEQSWTELFEENDVWTENSAAVSNLMFTSFRPVLYQTASSSVIVELHDAPVRTDREMPERPEDVILDE